jgi:hypothetical protein
MCLIRKQYLKTMKTPLVAFDESGNTGQNLTDDFQPTYTLVSVYFSDPEADQLIRILEGNNPEVHFVNLKRRPSGRDKILI